MVKRVTKKSRGKVTKKRKKIILVGTEGKNKTETNYLQNFNRHLHDYCIVFPKGNATDPIGVVNNTSDSIDEDFTKDDLVFCLLDVDFNSKENKIEKAIKKANKNKIIILLSNPIFEIWFLLHFKFSTKKYNSNDEVINDLKKYILNYQKNENVFNLIFDKSSTAINNAKKLENTNKSMGYNATDKGISNTEVYKLIEILLNDILN